MSFGLSGTVARVLNQALGTYLEDINSDQLNMNVFSGKVALRDISVKSTVFESLPIPFKLVYGKVGLIDVDVPVTSLFSSPLKIKISDVFVLINPKESSEWDEAKEIQNFKNSVQSRLQGLEDYFTSREEIEEKDPGMLSKMLSNIIDNLQIEVTNICIRYEDKLSNPNMPFCLGLTIPYLSTYTANDKWEKEFITKKDVCNKALMLDDFCLYLNFGEDMFYESLTKDFDVENLSTEDKKVINKTKGAERRQQFEIMKYKYFIEDSNRGLHKNSYLIHKF